MSKDKTASTNMLLGELFQAGLYKRTQGRVTRQITFAVSAIVFALAAWRFQVTFQPSFSSNTTSYMIAMAILLGGLWFSYRLVNMPRFADFLIAVEAEMNKVSWPSQGELVRSSTVVIFVIFMFSASIFIFDLVWRYLFQAIGVIQ